MLIPRLLTIGKSPSRVPKNEHVIAPPNLLPIAPSRAANVSFSRGSDGAAAVAVILDTGNLELRREIRFWCVIVQSPEMRRA